MRKYKSLAFRLTNRCNLRCSMCGQAKLSDINNSEELPLDVIKNTVDFLVARNKDIQVYLWGGEPLLYGNLEALLVYLHKIKVNTFITTNGVLLDKYIRTIVDNKVTEIAVSMDGLGEDYDTIRGGKGLYKKVIKNLQALDQYKKDNHAVFPIVDIHFVILPDNYKKIYAFVQEISKLKIARRIRLQFPMWFTKTMCVNFEQYVRDTFKVDTVISCETFESTFDIDISILKNELKKVLNDYSNILVFPSDIYPDKWFYEPEFTNRKTCNLCKYRINVEPNGDVITCTDFPETRIGNICYESLEKILNSNILKKHCEYIEQNLVGICPRCSSLYLF